MQTLDSVRSELVLNLREEPREEEKELWFRSQMVTSALNGECVGVMDPSFYLPFQVSYLLSLKIFGKCHEDGNLSSLYSPHFFSILTFVMVV